MAGSFRLAQLPQLDGVRPPKIAPNQAAQSFVVGLDGVDEQLRKEGLQRQCGAENAEIAVQKKKAAARRVTIIWLRDATSNRQTARNTSIPAPPSYKCIQFRLD